MLRTCCCERLKLRSTPSGTPCGGRRPSAQPARPSNKEGRSDFCPTTCSLCTSRSETASPTRPASGKSPAGRTRPQVARRSARASGELTSLHCGESDVDRSRAHPCEGASRASNPQRVTDVVQAQYLELAL